LIVITTPPLIAHAIYMSMTGRAVEAVALRLATP